MYSREVYHDPKSSKHKHIAWASPVVSLPIKPWTWPASSRRPRKWTQSSLARRADHRLHRVHERTAHEYGLQIFVFLTSAEIKTNDIDAIAIASGVPPLTGSLAQACDMKYNGVLYKHSELTKEIIAAFFAVYSSLGTGFLEKVHPNTLRLGLSNLEIKVSQRNGGWPKINHELRVIHPPCRFRVAPFRPPEGHRDDELDWIFVARDERCQGQRPIY